MELLPEGQRNTATEVSWEDQQKINKFSTLIGKKDEASEDLEKLKTEKEYLDDLLLEIELLDEDEKIQYKIGEVFVALKQEAAIARLEKSNEHIEGKIEDIDSNISELDEKLNELKSQLYARFGSNINLER
ncbi:prefoldin subunit 4 [[Candida] railenensis]|uniref:Prefoldin subunit 4 n=1 Tax=[Candida] railenensis TaxID=45579 RepID=A0A9P0QMU3_9ASCO|nr:prefoldin subunit 4 [[Candida] railenensis]